MIAQASISGKNRYCRLVYPKNFWCFKSCGLPWNSCKQIDLPRMESVSCCKRNGGFFRCRSRCHIPSWEDDGLGRRHTTNTFLQQRQCLPNLGEIDTAHCSGKQKGTGRFSGCGGRQSAEEDSRASLESLRRPPAKMQHFAGWALVGPHSPTLVDGLRNQGHAHKHTYTHTLMQTGDCVRKLTFSVLCGGTIVAQSLRVPSRARFRACNTVYTSFMLYNRGQSSLRDSFQRQVA